MKIKSFEELDAALLEMSKSQAVIQEEEAAMNKEIQDIKERYDERTAETSGTIASISDAVEKFCNENKSEFDKQRSRVLTHGKVGFRNNPPKVMQLNKKWKVESSIAFLKKLFGKKYLREKPELNKDVILADYAKEIIADEDLAGVGLRVDQDETFYIEVNWENINQKSAAA